MRPSVLTPTTAKKRSDGSLGAYSSGGINPKMRLMNEEIIFSFYQKDDFELLLSIILEFRLHLERTPEKKSSFRRENIEKDEREYLNHNSSDHNYSFFIAKFQKEIVGYIWFGQQDEDRTKGFIGELFVRNNFRKRGIAKVLLWEAQKWIEDRKQNLIEQNNQRENSKKNAHQSNWK